MNLIKLLFTQLLILTIITVQVDSFIEPVTFAIGSIVIAGISLLYKSPETKHLRESAAKFAYRSVERICEMVGYCEGCEDYWIHGNLKGLENDLNEQVFGQPLAIEMVLGALKSHLSSNKRRALVLSLQGSPGTGKNFVGQMILKNMFKKGDGSKYAMFFRGSIDFPLKAEVHEYKKKLVETIGEKVYQCHRSVFVFDEVEKMPDGLLDVISGFVNAEKKGEYDFRRMIFILLSNVGSDALNRKVLDSWQNGIPRDQISSKELTKLLATEAFNSDGGLKHSRLVQNYDVSHFVPFLPLERQHVVQCLKQEVVSRGQPISSELIELVLEELTFYPEGEAVFSTHGCKGVGEKADYLIERESRRRRQIERQRL